jgi:hypothetical protein
MPEDDVISGYLPDGVLVVNYSSFTYKLGKWKLDPEISVLVDVPMSLINGFEFRCSHRADIIDGLCIAVESERHKGFRASSIVGMAIGAVALLVSITVRARRSRRAAEPFRPLS